MNNSYTLDSFAGYEAMVARLPGHYAMDLNRTDMQTVIKALHLMMTRLDVDERWLDRASDLYGTFATTLGVDLV